MPEIKNYMEDAVKDMINSVCKSLNICQCEKCRYDIMAIALNLLPPKYIVTREGQLYTKVSMLQNQYDVDIVAALTKAAGIVGRNPRHDTD